MRRTHSPRLSSSGLTPTPSGRRPWSSLTAPFGLNGVIFLPLRATTPQTRPWTGSPAPRPYIGACTATCPKRPRPKGKPTSEFGSAGRRTSAQEEAARTLAHYVITAIDHYRYGPRGHCDEGAEWLPPPPGLPTPPNTASSSLTAKVLRQRGVVIVYTPVSICSTHHFFLYNYTLQYTITTPLCLNTLSLLH